MNDMNIAAGSESTHRGRLVVVSNRLPVSMRRDDGGKWRSEPASGGLVTALAPVLRDRGGVWVGWNGAAGDGDELAAALDAAGKDAGYTLRSVALTADEVHNFYLGFSNEVVWPLFHDLQSLCNFEPAYWRTYCEVNRRFAEVVARNAEPGDFIWVHDYHLMNVAGELRRAGVRSRVGFFLHIQIGRAS